MFILVYIVNIIVVYVRPIVSTIQWNTLKLIIGEYMPTCPFMPVHNLQYNITTGSQTYLCVVRLHHSV